MFGSRDWELRMEAILIKTRFDVGTESAVLRRMSRSTKTLIVTVTINITLATVFMLHSVYKETICLTTHETEAVAKVLFILTLFDEKFGIS